MNRKYALTLAILITGLIASNVFLFNFSSSESSIETVRISRIIDGDTLVLDDGRKIRLLNINAPEKSEYGYELSSNHLKSFENKTVQL